MAVDLFSIAHITKKLVVAVINKQLIAKNKIHLNPQNKSIVEEKFFSIMNFPMDCCEKFN